MPSSQARQAYLGRRVTSTRNWAGHNVESLGDVFADLVQRALAARAGFVLDIDDGLDMRQMGRQRAAIASTLKHGFGALSSRTAFFV